MADINQTFKDRAAKEAAARQGRDQRRREKNRQEADRDMKNDALHLLEKIETHAKKIGAGPIMTLWLDGRSWRTLGLPHELTCYLDVNDIRDLEGYKRLHEVCAEANVCITVFKDTGPPYFISGRTDAQGNWIPSHHASVLQISIDVSKPFSASPDAAILTPPAPEPPPPEPQADALRLRLPPSSPWLTPGPSVRAKLKKRGGPPPGQAPQG